MVSLSSNCSVRRGERIVRGQFMFTAGFESRIPHLRYAGNHGNLRVMDDKRRRMQRAFRELALAGASARDFEDALAWARRQLRGAGGHSCAGAARPPALAVPARPARPKSR